jgi:VCBS repeat-containing protein
MWKLILVCAAFGLAGATTTETALAWGCVAVDSQGAYGYSYNWPSEQDAELTALQQCEKHTKTYDCQTESCDPNG